MNGLASLVPVLAVLVLAAGGGAWLLRHRGAALRGRSRLLGGIEERCALGPKQSLAIVRVCGERILLAVTEQSVVSLGSIGERGFVATRLHTAAGEDGP